MAGPVGYEVRYQFKGELVVQVPDVYGEFAAEGTAKLRVRQAGPLNLTVAPGIELAVNEIDFQTIEVQRVCE